MPCVIKIIGLVTGQPTEHDDKYLVDFDPGPKDLPLRECRLITSTNVSDAKKFPSVIEASEEWKRVDPREPTRPWDGKPNRPLTVFTIQIMPYVEVLH